MHLPRQMLAVPFGLTGGDQGGYCWLRPAQSGTPKDPAVPGWAAGQPVSQDMNFVNSSEFPFFRYFNLPILNMLFVGATPNTGKVEQFNKCDFGNTLKIDNEGNMCEYCI